MADPDAITFTRLADGTLLGRQPDGSYRPVASGSDRARLAALDDVEIERMSATDPDHPGLDDAFWDRATIQPPVREAISIEIDSDVLRYFRRAGHGYEARINAALRRAMRTDGETG